MSLMCKKHEENITYLFAISITEMYISPAPKLAYIASPDNFSWVPKLFIDTSPPLNAEQSFPKTKLVNLCENSWFPCNPLYDSKEWGQLTKSIVSRVLIILKH